VKKAGNGMYAFVLYGSFELAGQTLNERDALGITDFDQFELKALTKDAEILLMEIPMQL
jgi:redox-sensitive bicupin YhaK (pirin superfamily)